MGDKGFLFCRGDDGADRYYDMWLYSWGLEFYYFDDESLQGLPSSKADALASKISREQTKALSLQAQPAKTKGFANQALRLDAKDFDLEHPEPYLYERSGPGYSLRIEGASYRPKEGG